MTKRIIAAVLSIVLLAGIMPVTAKATMSGTCGKNLTWVLDDEGTLIISGTGEMDNYSYGGPWYNYGEDIISVSIEKGVTSIGEFAFFECSELKSIAMPEGISSVGFGAFSRCSKLINAIIPDSVTNIGSYAFEFCSSLKNVKLSDNLASVDDGAFYGCSSLTEVALPSSVTNIGMLAFYDCTSLNNVYYGGTKSQWSTVGIGFGNECLTNAVIHYESNGPEDNGKAERVYLEDLEIVASDRYTGNQGDSFINVLGTRNGTTDIHGNVMEHGLEAWIARWNFKNESSWAWAEYALNGQYSALTGKLTIISDSYNTATFDSTIEILGDGVVLYSSSLTPDMDVMPVNVNISGVNTLRIYVHDNSSTKGGTSFALWDFAVGNEGNMSKKATPAGYNFLEDSYSFENFGVSKISKKYFTTMYGDATGKLLYQAQKNMGDGGVCFGMATTTAAIYNGFPDCTDFCTEHFWTADEICEVIRDIEKKSVVNINENSISLLDYIKYAHIYQLSSAVAQSSAATWNDIDGLMKAVENCLNSDTIGVTIGMTHYVQNDQGKWESDGGHRVLAVGIDGNDILIDDPNNTAELERLTIHENGTWSYSAPWTVDGVNSTNSLIRYQTDISAPYNVLLTGNIVTANSDYIDSDETVESYVDGMNTVDSDKLLVYIESDDYSLDNPNVFEIVVDGFTSNSADVGSGQLYWIDNDKTVSVSGMSEIENTVMLAGGDLLMGASFEEQGQITLSMDSGNPYITLLISEGEDCLLSFSTTGASEEDVVISVSGIAGDEVVTVAKTDSGISVDGISQGTVTLQHDDREIYSEELDDSDSVIYIDYDEDGTDETIQIEYVRFGDANGDGVINNVDAMLVLQYAVGLKDGAELELAFCDVNGDGYINNVDAMQILQFAVGLITEFKAAKN